MYNVDKLKAAALESWRSRVPAQVIAAPSTVAKATLQDYYTQIRIDLQPSFDGTCEGVFLLEWNESTMQGQPAIVLFSASDREEWEIPS